jgi:Tol biopolymer transport system component/tRNA A-37 threonylcarbamoyl transferase component Bud32
VRELLHYKIIAPLGQGAMGEVFRALDQKLGREVALKMLPADIAAERTSQARLVREARAASALNHPGIVTLHDIESVEGQSFIVMELVEGERFSTLAKRKLPWQRAVELVASVGESLAFAHARDVLHRDIKSDNLMVTPSGQTKVLDFGLAKLRDEITSLITAQPTATTAPPEHISIAETLRSNRSSSSDLTQAGQIVGTPAYMAPECFEGKASVRSEVFALGIVLYELLTGARPFDRETATATMIAIQLDEAPAPSSVREDVPERVDALVARAIAKQADDRFADMRAFVAALRDVLHVRAPRWPWFAVAGGGVVLVGGIAYGLAGGDRDEKPIEIAITASRRITFDPGCEEYPRLHPDGKRVVYDGVTDGNYDVQIRELDGKARRLTTSAGWDYASAVSPDGTLVAYVHEDPHGKTLRVVGIDGGEPRELGTISGYPAWSKSGVLLVGDAFGQIVKRGLDGKDTVLGRLPAGARLYHLVEVGDHGVALLWWTSSEADATALGELAPNGTLRVVEQSSVDYEGGLAAGRRGYYVTRKGATEGNQLLFRAWGAARANVVGGGLSPGAGIDIAPDGKRLVFSTCVERQYVARLVAGAQPQVVSQGKWQDTNPRSVDDTRVLVTSDRTGTMQGWLLDSRGEPRAVTPTGALGAAPSPDGKSIVYAANGGRGGLAIVGIDGGEARALTRDASDTSPSFTRDGTHVVFERTNAEGETTIYVVPAAGGDARLLVAGAQPATSPVDDVIIYLTAADATGARRVLQTDLAGATPRLVNLEAAAWQRPRISPDGKRLVVVRGFQQIVTSTIDGSAPNIEWTATTGSVSTADFARDGSILAALGDYDGDLWLADGNFP